MMVTTGNSFFSQSDNSNINNEYMENLNRNNNRDNNRYNNRYNDIIDRINNRNRNSRLYNTEVLENELMFNERFVERFSEQLYVSNTTPIGVPIVQGMMITRENCNYDYVIGTRVN